MTVGNTKDVFKDCDDTDMNCFVDVPEKNIEIIDETAAAGENVELEIEESFEEEEDPEVENDENSNALVKRKNKNAYKVEGNILEHPFFLMATGPRNSNNNTIEYTWTDDNSNKRTLQIVGGTRLPGVIEMDVTYALLKLFDEQQPRDGFVKCTIYDICKELGYQISGRSYEMVTNALRCLHETTIYSGGKGTIYVKKNGDEEGEYIRTKAQGLHIIENFESDIIEKIKKNGEKQIYKETLKLKLNSYFLTNLVGKYYKYINYNTYFSLTKGITRRLFVYLEKKKNNKAFFSINYDTLAKRIPITRSTPSYVRGRIEEPVKELIEKNVIAAVDYEETKVTFYFKKKMLADAAKPKVEYDYDFFDGNYKKALMDRGVSKGVAEKILNLNFSNEMIEKYLFYFGQFSKEHHMENPPGFIYTMFMEEFPIPENVEELYKEAKQQYLNRLQAVKEKEELLEEQYNLYLDGEMLKFKEREPSIYKIMMDTAFSFYKNNTGRILDADPKEKKLFEELQYDYPPVLTKFKNSVRGYLSLYTKAEWLKMNKKNIEG